MKFVVGLGNPGEKYAETRHNVGFMIIDALADDFHFPRWHRQGIFKAQISQGIFKRQKIILVKPQTFMNGSGKAVGEIIKKLPARSAGAGKWWEKEIENLIVIHDDLDLPLGKIKICRNRSSAGHKGIQSIIDRLKTKNFVRLRVGIGEQGNQKTGNQKGQKIAENFVLKKFNKKEQEIINETIKKTTEIIGFYLEQGLEKTMTLYNK